MMKQGKCTHAGEMYPRRRKIRKSDGVHTNRKKLNKLIPAVPEAGVKEADALECAIGAGGLCVAAGRAFLFFRFDVDAAGLDIAADLPDVVHREIAQFIELFTCGLS